MFEKDFEGRKCYLEKELVLGLLAHTSSLSLGALLTCLVVGTALQDSLPSQIACKKKEYGVSSQIRGKLLSWAHKGR